MSKVTMSAMNDLFSNISFCDGGGGGGDGPGDMCSTTGRMNNNPTTPYTSSEKNTLAAAGAALGTLAGGTWGGIAGGYAGSMLGEGNASGADPCDPGFGP